ncbi:MAG TPA: carbon starvation CstA family protein, partial [Nitrosospira sp.]|nr:carbon starvation CstA family protein [Nitrosospira sp.]
MNRFIGRIAWLALAVLGAFAFGVIALQHGESIGAIWIVVATVCIYAIAYRFYSLFIASRVLRL